MKFTIHLFIIMIAYLLGGAMPFPDDAQNIIFDTPFFAGFTAVYCVYMVVYCAKRGFKRDKLFFQFMHIGVAVIAIGVGIGFVTGISGTFLIPIDSEQMFDEIPIEEEYVGLGFDITVSDFTVEKYDPVYDAYRVNEHTGQEQFLAEGFLRDGVYDFGEYGSFTEAEMKDNGEFVDKKETPDGTTYYKHEADKQYDATLVFSLNGANPVEKSLQVNHPVTYGGWKFYLLSYDTVNMEYLTLEAKNDIGVPLVIFGIWVTIIATFGHCIIVKKD